MHERREEETVRGLGIDYPQSRLNTFPLPNVFFFKLSTTPFTPSFFLELLADEVYLFVDSGLVSSNS